MPRHLQDLCDLASVQSGSINNLFDTDPFNKEFDDPSTLKEGNSCPAPCRFELSPGCFPIAVMGTVRMLASIHSASRFFDAETSLQLDNIMEKFEPPEG